MNFWDRNGYDGYPHCGNGQNGQNWQNAGCGQNGQNWQNTGCGQNGQNWQNGCYGQNGWQGQNGQNCQNNQNGAGCTEDDVRARFEQYSGKSEGQLMDELLESVRRMKGEGSFDPSALENLYKTAYPFLSEAQRERMRSIIDMISR